MIPGRRRRLQILRNGDAHLLSEESSQGGSDAGSCCCLPSAETLQTAAFDLETHGFDRPAYRLDGGRSPRRGKGFKARAGGRQFSAEGTSDSRAGERPWRRRDGFGRGGAPPGDAAACRPGPCCRAGHCFVRFGSSTSLAKDDKAQASAADQEDGTDRYLTVERRSL